MHPQVGVAGYRIDLGVKHPQYPYGYLMGIECDGATYHSAKSARERDIIRQQILEGLGWRIYRIWSTDWFANPTDEFGKLKNYIQQLLEKESHHVVEDDVTLNEQGAEAEEALSPAIFDDKAADVKDTSSRAPAEVTDGAVAQSINTDKQVALFDTVRYVMVKKNGKSGEIET